jgi:ATP-dependent Clp protease ATP-binding subunit ClpX
MLFQQIFFLLFTPDDNSDPIVLNEPPSEDALLLDPHPIVITCTEDNMGEILITGVDYDLEALNDARKVDTLYEILNYHGTIDKLLKENDSQSYLDVPTFMKSDLKYPEDFTHHCGKCDSEFVSFSLRYADNKKAIMCPKCLQLYLIDFKSKTYQIPDEIKAFEKYFQYELDKYDSVLSFPIAYNDRQFHKPLSYLLEHSLYSTESIERIRRRGWGGNGAYYRTIEEFKIEQLRYFLIDKEGGWRKKLLGDIRMLRALQDDQNKFKTKYTGAFDMSYKIYQLQIFNRYFNEYAQEMDIVAEFEYKLKHSLSLNRMEKIRVITEYPNLSQFQLRELIKVFDDEEAKFENLSEEHPSDIQLLKTKTQEEWEMILEEFGMLDEIKDKVEEGELRDQYNLPTPRAIKAYMDEFVRGQDEAKQELSSAMYYQSLALKLQALKEKTMKPSLPIILVGPTGNGKTYVVQKACEISKLPFVHINTSSMVSEGIVGFSIGDIGRRILSVTKERSEESPFAVVFLDEFDKLGKSDSKKGYGQEVMHQLLRIIEGGDIVITPDHKRGESDEIVLSTKNMLFILAGAFQDKYDFDNRTKVGFGNHPTKKISKDIGLEELEEYGMPKEILGRIGSIITLKKLGAEDMYAILTESKESPLKEFIHKIKIHGDTVEVEDEALREIANMASESPFGVRTIRQVLSKVFAFPIYDAPGRDKKTYKITREHLAEVLSD